jgi:hypothetical protein
MVNRSLDLIDIKSRYCELLKEAEQERRAWRLRAHKPRLQARVLKNLGGTLIAVGQSLKTLSLSL